MKRRFLALAGAAGLITGLATTAAADDRDDLQNELKSNKQQQEELTSQLEGTTVALQETYLALEVTRQQIPLVQQELATARSELAAAERVQQETAGRLAYAQAEFDALTAEIEGYRAEIEASRGALGQLARTTYQNGQAMTSTALMVGSASAGEFLAQYSAVDAAVRAQTAVLSDRSALEVTTRNAQARQQAVTERIAQLKAAADQAVADAEAARAVAQQKESQILALERDQQTYAGQLESRSADIQQQQAQIDSDNADLRNRIAAIDEENRRKEEEARRAAAQAPSRSDTGAVAAGSAASAGLGLPINPPLYVTSPYGYRVYPITGGWFMHYGVDLRSACGNPQFAVAAGTVTDVRNAAGNGTHGNQVIINNGVINGNSYVTVYNHLSRFAVSRGQQVSKGQTIAYTGATGNVTGCHVHFEVWKNGSSIDPMTLPGY